MNAIVRTTGARGGRTRRGNTIVLVVGILVLLVIIATSYVTRTHAGRVTAVSQQRASLRDDNARVIAESIADEIGGALFVRPLANAPSGINPIVSSNAPRLTPRTIDFDGDGIPEVLPVRYGVDPRDDNGDSQPDVPYNFAPYQVAPFTNWPDGVGWPVDPGTTDPFEGNPVGNPGFGDTRWLADLEPVRVLLPSASGIAPGALIFSHWRHMTNLSRPGNGWRICKDISDVGNRPNVATTGFGGVVLDLGIPVEQFIWRPGDMHTSTATTGLPNVIGGPPPPAHDLVFRWRNWFFEGPYTAALPGYIGAYDDDTWIPPNFLNLRDLDGNDNAHDFYIGGVAQDRPEAEFNPGTARHAVGRYLADTDGDGFTDAFWFLAPTMTERGIRQIVAVRIIDNSGMLNANVATRFAPMDLAGAAPYRTRGTTPADLALVGDMSTSAPGGGFDYWNVGFYDNDDHPDNMLAAPSPLELWQRHLAAVGLRAYTLAYLADPDMPDQFWREDYWRRQGSFPLGADTRSAYTPFGIPDEIELRMFYGNNYPWIFSRLEGTTEVSANIAGALRGTLFDRGSSEILDQLRNPDLVGDSRHKLTLYSGARNDLMPPWLWPTLLITDRNLILGIDDGDVRQYRADMRKYDLRQSYYTIEDTDGDGLADDNLAWGGDVDRDGQYEPPGASGLLTDPTDDDIDDSGGPPNEADQLARMRDYLDRALVIRNPRTGEPLETYFGKAGDATDADLERAERMAAAMAANITAYRDKDQDVSLTEAVPLRFYDRNLSRVVTDKTVRYLGLEAQPFLVEAAIAHVHGTIEAQRNHDPVQPNPLGIAQFDNVMCYDGSSGPDQSSIIAVQIANPFDKPVDLNNFRISVFGQNLDLDAVVQNQLLQPDTARTYLSMNLAAGPNPINAPKWQQILGLDTIGPADLINTNVWSRDRSYYDGNTLGDSAIELWRRVDPLTDVWVLVDRIDVKPGLPDEPDPGGFGNNCTYRKFGPLVTQLLSVSLDLQIQPTCQEPPVDGDPWPGVLDLGPTRDHWAQWIRVSRPWDYDVNGNGTIDPGEKNPRYVFGRAQVDMIGSGEGRPYTDADSPLNWFGGQVAYFGSRDKKLCDGITDPINTQLDFAMQMLQKDNEFEQIGELLDVWLFGDEIRTDLAGNYQQTTSTFSEWLFDEIFDSNRGYTGAGERRAVNRLHPEPVDNGDLKTGAIMGEGNPLIADDPLHAIPALPATARVMEAFVCDGHGAAPLADIDGDGGVDFDDAQVLRLNLANAFSGRMTPGLINVNTAPPEVMQSLPQMARLVGFDQSGGVLTNPRVHVPEAIANYRDRIVRQYEPDYRQRNLASQGLRSDRGIASIGELLLLQKTAAAPPGYPNPSVYPDSFRIDFAANDSFFNGQSARISTDVIDDGLPGFQTADAVANDVEEANLLFAGMSNLITTRSDVFTVYFKVRSFTQNPVTGRWDATDPEHIVDDSRFVMLVDRSEVNRPSDKPKIVYLEKLPK